MNYVVARTASGRPSLQHILHWDSYTLTLCGLSVREWSRAYMEEPIDQILCKKCNRINGLISP